MSFLDSLCSLSYRLVIHLLGLKSTCYEILQYEPSLWSAILNYPSLDISPRPISTEYYYDAVQCEPDRSQLNLVFL